MNNTVTINKYLPVVVLYFFLNGFLLPLGLLYTTILTPFFLIWLSGYRSFRYIWIYFFITVPFFVVHLLQGVDLTEYLQSWVLLFSVYIFGLTCYQFFINCQSCGQLYKQILVINAFLVLIAGVALFVPPLKSYFWYSNPITQGIASFDRLKMLTYEPSYYSLLLAPVVLYYVLKMILLNLQGKLLTLALILVPLLLSLSFGILFGLLFSLFFLFLFDIRLFSIKKSFPVYLIFGMAGLLLVFITLLILYPDNILFLRVANVLSGRDISFSGRTFDSFFLSWQIASEKSVWFGVGPGQVKSIGLPFFKSFYKYDLFTEAMIGIPNAIGDTLATFGITGVFLRLLVQVYLFFRTRVFMNYYRLCLFLFVFIYQFTGSFITNIAELVIWVIAFSPWAFKEFNRKSIYSPIHYQKNNYIQVPE